MGLVLCLLVETLSPGINYDTANGYYTVVIDLNSDSTEVRVALPHSTAQGDMETVATHAGDEGATVAINANYFGGSVNYPCGLGRGFGQTYSDGYMEAGNCELSMMWARGAAAVIDSLGHEHDSNFHTEYSDAATGGGWLLQNGQRHDWNHAKLEEGRDCTAIGVSADRSKFIMVVTDPTSCTGAGLQSVLLAHGAADAIHLDGGGSSKLFIAGRGYVNGEPQDRAPPIVILARPNGQCPSDCGNAQCVQLLRPFRAQCVGQACRAGLGALWNCDQAQLRRARCNGGVVEKEYCAMGCMPMANGQDDVCIGGATSEPDAGVPMPDAGPIDAPANSIDAAQGGNPGNGTGGMSGGDQLMSGGCAIGGEAPLGGALILLALLLLVRSSTRCSQRSL